MLIIDSRLRFNWKLWNGSSSELSKFSRLRQKFLFFDYGHEFLRIGVAIWEKNYRKLTVKCLCSKCLYCPKRCNLSYVKSHDFFFRSEIRFKKIFKKNSESLGDLSHSNSNSNCRIAIPKVFDIKYHNLNNRYSKC